MSHKGAFDATVFRVQWVGVELKGGYPAIQIEFFSPQLFRYVSLRLQQPPKYKEDERNFICCAESIENLHSKYIKSIFIIKQCP